MIHVSRSAALRALLKVRTDLDLTSSDDRDWLYAKLATDLSRAADYLSTTLRLHAAKELTDAEFLQRHRVCNTTIDDINVALDELQDIGAR